MMIRVPVMLPGRPTLFILDDQDQYHNGTHVLVRSSFENRPPRRYEPKMYGEEWQLAHYLAVELHRVRGEVRRLIGQPADLVQGVLIAETVAEDCHPAQALDRPQFDGSTPLASTHAGAHSRGSGV